MHADACEQVAVWRDGRQVGSVCRADAPVHGLTVIDLRDDWVPPVLAGDEGSAERFPGRHRAPAYRATYRALAQERFADAGLDGKLAVRDRYLELFGIVPTLTVVRDRLSDEERHRCHDAVDDIALAALAEPIERENVARAKRTIARAKRMRRALVREIARGELSLVDVPAVLEAIDRYRVAWLIEVTARYAAVDAAQAHLACDALVTSRPIRGVYTSQTTRAIEAFQRGEVILPHGVLDADTREALLDDSRERDFRTALRVLRARVTAATGLVEDGTAGTGPARVLGRRLEPDQTWRVRGHQPLDDATPDLVSAATEIAARALGWRDAASTLAFLAEQRAPEVAIALPPMPRYHAAPMDLSIVIDRGDIASARSAQQSDTSRRPALIIYARDGARRVALARWPTTIGGWQYEKRANGAIVKTWKESPVGARVWRDVFVGPTWLPPDSTPDRELVRSHRGRYVLARERLGPSYRGAFGIVAFSHLVPLGEGERVRYAYRGVRTHGTGNAVSIAQGASHGCHRLLGAHAIRLGSFVLRHREHVRRGRQSTRYRRVVVHEGRFPVSIDSRGYRIELVPPIPVDVVSGRGVPGAGGAADPHAAARGFPARSRNQRGEAHARAAAVTSSVARKPKTP